VAVLAPAGHPPFASALPMQLSYCD